MSKRYATRPPYARRVTVEQSPYDIHYGPYEASGRSAGFTLILKPAFHVLTGRRRQDALASLRQDIAEYIDTIKQEQTV